MGSRSDVLKKLIDMMGTNPSLAVQMSAHSPTSPSFSQPEYTSILGDFPGRIFPGNISLLDRPVVLNPDGSRSTVRSMSFEENGREILIPTVSDDGRIMTEDEAIATYRRTGRNLGVFATSEAATRYAKLLHEAYEQGKIPGYK